jgi:AcrR family transcriptional regulator
MPTRQLKPQKTVPTGIPIPDIRSQLFEAADRVLLRQGPDALTSRAVTTEAGVAKGILYRHFPDFDSFLAAFVLTHIERLDSLSSELRAAAGEAAVVDNLARAFAGAFSPAAVQIVSLVCSRRELLSRLRLTTPTGIPLATEIIKMIAAYLTAERGLGRIPLQVDVDALAVLLVGGAHLRATERDGLPLEADDLRDLLSAAIGSTALDHATRAATT